MYYHYNNMWNTIFYLLVFNVISIENEGFVQINFKLLYMKPMSIIVDDASLWYVYCFRGTNIETLIETQSHLSTNNARTIL